jgi:hypothetical protein
MQKFLLGRLVCVPSWNSYVRELHFWKCLQKMTEQYTLLLSVKETWSRNTIREKFHSSLLIFYTDKHKRREWSRWYYRKLSFVPENESAVKNSCLKDFEDGIHVEFTNTESARNYYQEENQTQKYPGRLLWDISAKGHTLIFEKVLSTILGWEYQF